ncbi:MAG: nitroreductase family protein [Candidatus Bathyarchaeia archaeon]|nr:nitroreductase family protein [Candidatus Bathyarchaeota archaeon]
MDIIEIIKTRRTIRKIKPDPIEKDKLLAVLEAARWAPSWANTQCWEFIIVMSAETKEKLAETLTPGNPAVEAVKGAPVVIVACAKLGLSGFLRGKQVTDKGDWFMFDVALALQNLVLTAWSLGLGTVYVGAFDAKKAGELLGVPPGVSVVALVPLGYPVEVPREPPRRKELKEFVYLERYGNKMIT